MRNLLNAFLVLLIPLLIIATMMFSLFYGFHEALVLAVDGGVIYHKGKIYSVKDTGETYPLSEEK